MIGEQQHDGVVREARIVECLQQHADLVVDIGDAHRSRRDVRPDVCASLTG